MGQLDTTVDGNYETRELAWELGQEHLDSGRIRFLMETGADLRQAMRMANLSEKDVLRNPHLRPLQLQRHLVQHAAL